MTELGYVHVSFWVDVRENLNPYAVRDTLGKRRQKAHCLKVLFLLKSLAVVQFVKGLNILDNWNV